jgi:hypothetical protein
MSVTFNRVQLIKVATEALVQHEKQKAVHAEAVKKFLDDHSRKNNNTVRVRKFRDYLTAELRKGGPIREPGEDVLGIGRGGGGGHLRDLFYSPPWNHIVESSVTVPKGLLSPDEYAATKSLVEVLTAVTDDTVSVNELRLLGWKNLRPVFTAAAQK